MSAGRRVNTLSHEWCTPAKYVSVVRNFFGGEIDLDPCSNNSSIVKATIEYKLPEKDGLKESWNFQKIYVNPPYGADRERGTTIKNWLAKCFLANQDYKSEVIALIITQKPQIVNLRFKCLKIILLRLGVCVIRSES